MSNSTKSQTDPPPEPSNSQPEAGDVEASSELKEPEYPDYGHLFNIKRPFKTLQEAKDSVTKIGNDNDMFFMIGTSKSTHVYIGCERSGKYRPNHSKNPNAIPRRGSGTKKSGCPFQLCLKRLKDGFWLAKTIKGKHNHELGRYCKGGSSGKRRKGKKMDVDIEDTEDGGMSSVGDPDAGMTLRDEFNKTVRDFMENATEADMSWFQERMKERAKGKESFCMDEPMMSQGKCLSGTGNERRDDMNESTSRTFLYAHEMPRHFLTFIRGHLPCDSDGNCGYRAISTAVYQHEREWKRVRHELIEELVNYSSIHSPHIGDHYQHIRDRLDWFHDGLAPPSKWYDVTVMGHLTATVYQRVVVCFSIFGSSTYLPLQSRSNALVPPPPKDTIYLGHVDNGKHWVLLRCAPFCPLPPLDTQWQFCANMNILPWASHFQERMNAWTAYANENWP